jgi:hypothetical protein
MRNKLSFESYFHKSLTNQSARAQSPQHDSGEAITRSFNPSLTQLRGLFENPTIRVSPVLHGRSNDS